MTITNAEPPARTDHQNTLRQALAHHTPKTTNETEATRPLTDLLRTRRLALVLRLIAVAIAPLAGVVERHAFALRARVEPARQLRRTGAGLLRQGATCCAHAMCVSFPMPSVRVHVSKPCVCVCVILLAFIRPQTRKPEKQFGVRGECIKKKPRKYQTNSQIRTTMKRFAYSCARPACGSDSCTRAPSHSGWRCPCSRRTRTAGTRRTPCRRTTARRCRCTGPAPSAGRTGLRRVCAVRAEAMGTS